MHSLRLPAAPATGGKKLLPVTISNITHHHHRTHHRPTIMPTKKACHPNARCEKHLENSELNFF
jgi:hypothetical protein